MTTAPTHAPARAGFATMVTPPPPADDRTVVGSATRWIGGAVQILFVGALVPLAMLLVGAPIALLVKGIIALLSR